MCSSDLKVQLYFLKWLLLTTIHVSRATTLFISIPSFIQEVLLSSPFIFMDIDIKKNKEDREIISNDNDALIKNPNDLHMVSSAISRAFAEEANVEERTTQADAAGSSTSDMAIKDRSIKQQNIHLKQAKPMLLKSLLPHESILADQLVDTKHPGAMQIFPGGIVPLQPMSGIHEHE